MNLKEQRKKLGLRQAQVASAAGIKQGYYTRVESGKQKPSVKTAKAIARVLNIDWTDFYKEREKGEKSYGYYTNSITGPGY